MKTPRNEHFLYFFAFLLALGLRLFALGSAPLSDFEADWALQSFDLARNISLIPDAQPGYVLPTTALFFLFQDANFTARLLPALAGSLLIFAPYGFRRQLGQKAALILAFGLAIDPGLVTLSRLAGGPMPAIAFTVLALALFAAPGGSRGTRGAWGGIAAGMALLSGAATISGALGLGIAYGAARWTGLLAGSAETAETETAQNPARGSLPKRKITLFFGAGTVLLAGTLFFLYPQGLLSWAATLDAYLALWQQGSDIPAGRLAAALFFYAILPLIFGVAGAARGWLKKRAPERALSLWFLAALLLPLLMPGRQVGDIAWALLPLWALAALELARYARCDEQPLPGIGLAGGIFALMTIIWLTIAALDFATPQSLPRYYIVVIASLLIGALGTLLVAVSWSVKAARAGLVWGVSAGLIIYTLAAMFGASQVRANTPQEWWWPAPTPKHADLVSDTLADLGLVQSGRTDSLDVISLVDTPSMRWSLRNIEGVVYANAITMDTALPVVIAHPNNPLPPIWEQLYRGQDFGWQQSPGWETALPPNALDWLINRNAPVVTEDIVIWARLDLFPSGTINPPEGGEDINVDEALPAP